MGNARYIIISVCGLVVRVLGYRPRGQEWLERFQSKTLRMIVDTTWYVPKKFIRRDLQIPTVKEEIRRYSSQYGAHLSAHPKWPNSEPHGATRQQATAKTPTKWSAHQIPSVFVVLVNKVEFVSLIPKSHRRFWTYYLQRSATEHSTSIPLWPCIYADWIPSCSASFKSYWWTSQTNWELIWNLSRATSVVVWHTDRLIEYRCNYFYSHNPYSLLHMS
jgi:hypothetical protein